MNNKTLISISPFCFQACLPFIIQFHCKGLKKACREVIEPIIMFLLCVSLYFLHIETKDTQKHCISLLHVAIVTDRIELCGNAAFATCIDMILYCRK